MRTHKSFAIQGTLPGICSLCQQQAIAGKNKTMALHVTSAENLQAFTSLISHVSTPVNFISLPEMTKFFFSSLPLYTRRKLQRRSTPCHHTIAFQFLLFEICSLQPIYTYKVLEFLIQIKTHSHLDSNCVKQNNSLLLHHHIKSNCRCCPSH